YTIRESIRCVAIGLERNRMNISPIQSCLPVNPPDYEPKHFGAHPRSALWCRRIRADDCTKALNTIVPKSSGQAGLDQCALRHRARTDRFSPAALCLASGDANGSSSAKPVQPFAQRGRRSAIFPAARVDANSIDL